MSNERISIGTGWWIAAAVFVLVSVLGLMDQRNVSYAGYTAPRFADVTAVTARSPAEDAGLRVGDRIVENHGVATDDYNALFRQDRARIGETRTLVVEREGESAPLRIQLTFAGLPTQSKVLMICVPAIGLAFLFCGLGAFTRSPNETTRLLAALGVVAMASFATTPYIPNAALRLLYAVVPNVGVLLIPALLLHFLLRFRTSRALSRRALALLYVPVAVAGSVVAWTLVFQAQLLIAARTAAVLVVVGQILFAIGVLIRGYLKADRDDRSAYGLHALVASFVLGFVPVLVSGFVPSVPGGQFYFLTIVLIPIALASTALKSAGGSAAELIAPPRAHALS